MLVPINVPLAVVKLLGNTRLPEKFVNLNDLELWGSGGDIEKFIISLTRLLKTLCFSAVFGNYTDLASAPSLAASDLGWDNLCNTYCSFARTGGL